MKSALEILREGRALVERGWLASALSDGQGRFCSIGALMACGHICDGRVEAYTLLWEAARDLYGKTVVAVNRTGREQTLRMWDAAIATAAIIERRKLKSLPEHREMVNMLQEFEQVEVV